MIDLHVLIVGVSTRAAAESAARAGFAVTALDAYADLDQHPSVRALSLPRDFGVPFSPEALVSAAREFPSDVLVYLSSLENHPKAVDELTSQRALWGNPSHVLRRVRHPRALADAFTRRGLSAPRVVMSGQTASLPRDVHRWMLKPRRSGGGHGVRRWQQGEPVMAGHYLQQFVDGPSGSIIFVAAGGRGVVLGITRQLVGDVAFGASGFRYCGNILTDDRQRLREAAALVDVVASEFALVGIGTIDIIVNNDSYWPLEVNPRWSASMELVERARGISLFELHADTCAKSKLPAFDLAAAPQTPATYGKAVVFARQDVIIGETRTWLEDSSVRDVPHAGERITAGEPICTVLTSGSNEHDCYAKLAERAARVYHLFA